MGFTSLCEQLSKRPSLIVLNYHRIGTPDNTQYDPGVFSATPEQFERQVHYLKQHFEIVTLDEAVDMVRGKTRFRSSVLLTFDDGYLDNYQLAFPILRSAGVQATFFLPTAFIGTGRLPWWDLIAYIVRNRRRSIVRLTYPQANEFDGDKLESQELIARVLRVYKHRDMKDHQRFIDDLLEGSGSELPAEDGEVCFMDWRQAREMQKGGMAFGSHTHNHEVLNKLPPEQQYEELARSREVLEQELQLPITTLAYPVGGKAAFSEETQKAAERSGYLAAFSHYGGFNLAGSIRPYNVQRFGVDQQTYPRFRLQMALGGVSGSVWF